MSVNPFPSYTAPSPYTGPLWESFTEMAPDYDAVTTVTEYEDLSISTNTNSSSPIRRWTITYILDTSDTASAAFLAALDAHYVSAAGQVGAFNFTDRNSVTISNVKYDKGGYEKSHTKQWIQHRVVKLILRPA
jgi:hypothetical protein